MKRLTASRVDNAFRCQYWLRDDVEWLECEPGPEARLGSAFHRAAELAARREHVDLVGLGAEWALDAHQQADLEAMFEHWLAWYLEKRFQHAEVEVAFAVDLATGLGRRLPSHGQRDYSAVQDGEIAGTADLVVPESDIVTVWDYKTGQRPVSPKSGQLLTLALAARAADGDMFAERKSGVLTVHPDGVRELVYRVSDVELDHHHQRLLTIPEIVAEGPEPQPWAGCRWCPAQSTCPATARTLATVTGEGHRFLPVIQSEQHAAWLVGAVETVEATLTNVKRALREYADSTGGIPLEDGTVWAGADHPIVEPDLDHPAALVELEAMGLGAAVTRRPKTSWAAITRAGGALKAKRAREVLTDLGAVRISNRRNYQARKQHA